MSKKEIVTWSEARFIAFEWLKCDINGNAIFEALFLLHDEILHRFRLWGASEERNLLERMKPLTICEVRFEWRYGSKWLRTVKPNEQ